MTKKITTFSAKLLVQLKVGNVNVFILPMYDFLMYICQVMYINNSLPFIYTFFDFKEN